MAYVGYPGYQQQFPQVQNQQMIAPQQFAAQYPQQLQQYQQQYQQQQNNNNGGIIWVQGEPGAKSFMVAPNATVQLWDSEDQVIYLKSADASGMPSIKILDYTIRENGKSNQPADNKSEYVTKADLEEFGDKIMQQIEGFLK